MKTYGDIHHEKIARENERTGREWAALDLPAWDDMSPEQQQSAISLAERQGQRSAGIQQWWASLTAQTGAAYA